VNDAPGADDQRITLTGEDGSAYECRVLGVFDFEGREYALLLKLAGGDEAATILMRLLERGDQAVFHRIEDDAEYERVTSFVKELAREMDSEAADQS
jgi:hypothetical protein